MKKLKGNVLIAQSGGPTAVINSSLCGIIQETQKEKILFENIYGAVGGIRGLINGEIIDLKKEDKESIENLKYTPGAALGSIRYKLKLNEDFQTVINSLKKFNIRYFFYIGGNDSMDTANKVNKIAAEMSYDLYCIGIPKTIDNDLAHTDYCPGYPSAAKYLATLVAEVDIDQRDLPTTPVVIIESMGRNSGWLAAASSLANRNNYINQGPHLIYLPEIDFNIQNFIKDVNKTIKKIGRVLIVVSEGIHTNDGKLLAKSNKTDEFGHSRLGGCANILKDIIDKELNLKSRVIITASAQRAASHIASDTDIIQAWICGKRAVNAVMQGKNGKMIAIKRESNDPYTANFTTVDLSTVANLENRVPKYMINSEGTYVTEDFIKYARPLISGTPMLKWENGLPIYSTLKKFYI